MARKDKKLARKDEEIAHKDKKIQRLYKQKDEQAEKFQNEIDLMLKREEQENALWTTELGKKTQL